VAALAVMSPWLVRNARLTGDPVFSLQARAELVKDTRTWPGYQVYRQLTPQPPLRVLRDDAVPVLRKAYRGLRFYRRDLYRAFPPLLLGGLLGILAWTLVHRVRRRAWPGPAVTPPALATATLLLLCLQYAFFNHSLRHLLPLLPVLAWEVAFAAGRDWRWAVLAALTVLAPPARLPGWQHAAHEAVAAQRARSWEPDRSGAVVDGVYFFDYAAGAWYLDRPGVWRSPAAEAAVPGLLRRGGAEVPSADAGEPR